jgi:outer membrane receptor protein involved in Fe transport
MYCSQHFQGRKLTAAITQSTALTIALCCAIPAQSFAAEEQIEEVVVTGSFIQRPADRPQPVTVIDNTQIQLEQKSSISEIFKTLPQVAGSVSTINTSEGGNSPTNTINLRGLGERATLVLMNGLRQTIDGGTNGGVSAVDIDNLAPSIMIERIEILTDGASALYGSDAVAGVVNFITRNDFDGFETRVNLQKIQDVETNTPDMQFGLIAGAQGENGGIVAGFEVAKTETLLVEDRYEDSRLLATLQSGFANPGSFTPGLTGSIVAGRRPDPLCGDSSLGSGLIPGFVVGSQCMIANSLGRTLQPESERYNGLAVITHNFDNAVSAQFEVGYAHTEYNIDFGYVTPLLFPLPEVPANNPGVIAANAADPSWAIQPYRWWGRPLSPPDGKPTVHTSQQDTYRVTGTLDGPIGDSGWSWTARGTISHNKSFFDSNDALNSRLLNALQGYGGPSCGQTPASDPDGEFQGVGNCLWFNPFANHSLAAPGDPEYNDPALLEYMIGSRILTGTAELRTLEAIVTGDLFDLPGGTTGVAFGVQTREQQYGQDWDDITNAGFNGTTGFRFNQDALPDFAGTRKVDAYFGELVMYPTDELEVQLALRYEDYGEVDSTDPKIGLLWTPRQGLFFRMSAGTSFRQPGEVQLFGVGSGGASTRTIGGDIIQARGVVRGDTGLAPEESENWTVGMTWDITENLTFDLNYWNVEFSNLIVQEGGDIILLDDMADGFITDPRLVLRPREGRSNEVCEVTGRWDGVNTATRPDDCLTGFDFQTFVVSYVNQDFQNTSGLDFTAQYDFEAFGSEWSTRLVGTWTHEYDVFSTGQQFDGVGQYNSTNFGVPNAELRANLSLDWRQGDHYARAAWRHISGLTEDDPTLTLSEEGDFDTLDLLFGTKLWNGIDVTASIINVTDEEDPIKQNALQTTTSAIFDTRGRVFRLGFGWAFE